ncbi:hypothetical protein QO179_15910 [Bacillus stercoris]|nr:hypothetical protein [Bacillus stercoris]
MVNEKIDELNKRVGRLEQELESVKREIAYLAAGKKEQTVVKTEEHPKSTRKPKFHKRRRLREKRTAL